MPTAPRVNLPTWESHVTLWQNCQRCPLASQRCNICLAKGTVPCDVLVCGEAPGASEDATGEVFCGPAGGLLDQIIACALPLGTTIAYCNLVCCFPREAKLAGDNEPTRSEIFACRPRLVEFVNIAQPRLIVRVGALATEYVAHDIVPVVDIVHPAHVLRKDVPLVKKDEMVRRAVVKVKCAVEEVMAVPREPWQQWGACYADVKKGLRQDYNAWSAGNTGQYDADIPF